MKWIKLKPHQFRWIKILMGSWCFAFLLLLLLYFIQKEIWLFIGAVSLLCLGASLSIIIFLRIRKTRDLSKRMEQFIRKNKLYESHRIIKNGLWKQRDIEVIDYYPQIEYAEIPCDNVFRLRFRLDGSFIAQKFRDLEQVLADMFYTICTDKIEERGYITYCFELHRQEQMQIQSLKDIVSTGDGEIVFSSDIVWNWKKVPHLLLTGNSGSGKTQLAQYIISCLLSQGVRVIYCDPKNDDDMRYFLKNNPSVVYVTQENEIAKAVREIEEEVRIRQMDLDNIGISEAEFNPVYILFDELIAFSKIADNKTYEETSKRLSAIVVTGRSKRVYVGMILQRPDASFIEGAIRDNLACKICMGQMSDTAYKMSFGSDFANVKNYRHEIGSGLIYRQGVDTKPREFLAPYICKGALSKRE